MPDVRSNAQFDDLMQKKLKKAINACKQPMKEAMKDGIEYFYAGGTPSIYERTGLLKQTPRVEDREMGAKEASIETFLSEGYGYNTGKHPSMAQVLVLSNEGAYPGLRANVGSTGYWLYSEEKMKEIFEKIMSQFLQ